MIKLPEILPPPMERPSDLPATAKWLSGEGAGSWFVIEEIEKLLHYHITRFSPEGIIECEGLFQPDTEIDLKKEFSITYPAHCSRITIIQEDTMIHFNPII